MRIVKFNKYFGKIQIDFYQNSVKKVDTLLFDGVLCFFTAFNFQILVHFYFRNMQ